MPLRTIADRAGGLAESPYCRHCGDERGALKSYDEVWRGMTAFLANAQGLDEAVARRMAREMMARMPAWAGRD
jgi:hypothetical protein